MKSSVLTSMSPALIKAKSGKYFGIHGRFCASHPWEVIVTTVTLTVCVLSMSILNGGKLGVVCGPNRPCQRKSPEEEVCCFYDAIKFIVGIIFRKLTHF